MSYHEKSDKLKELIKVVNSRTFEFTNSHKKFMLNSFRKSLVSKTKYPPSLCNSFEIYFRKVLRFGFRQIKDFAVRKQDQAEGIRKHLLKLLSSRCQGLLKDLKRVNKLAALDNMLNKAKPQTRKTTYNHKHLESPLTSIKRIIFSAKFRIKLSCFLSIKYFASKKPTIRKNSKLIFIVIRNLVRKISKNAFDTLQRVFLKNKSKLKQVLRVSKIFEKCLAEKWKMFKQEESIPKYFLSNYWKHNGFNPRTNFFKRSWKSVALSKLYMVIERKISCFQCFGYFRLMNYMNLNYSTTTSSPTKGLFNSNENSFVQSNSSKNEDNLVADSHKKHSPEVLYSHLWTLVMRLRKAQFFVKNFAYMKWKLVKKVPKHSPRIPCKFLPVCRKIQKNNTLSSSSLTNYKSVSPFARSPKKK